MRENRHHWHVPSDTTRLGLERPRGPPIGLFYTIGTQGDPRRGRAGLGSTPRDRNRAGCYRVQPWRHRGALWVRVCAMRGVQGAPTFSGALRATAGCWMAMEVEV